MYDGGMKANNPIEAGLWQLSSIWPGHARPGLVLSVGTGYQDAPAHELATSTAQTGVWTNTCFAARDSSEVPRSHSSWLHWFWCNSFVPRIFRAFYSSPCLHGQNSWKALLNRVDEHSRGDFFRLNLEFLGQEPPLDDSNQLSRLSDLASNCTLDLRAYRDAIWASAFFYELVELPQLYHGYYTCRGMIYCTFQDARPLLQAIRRAYPLPKLMLGDTIITEFGAERDCCSTCGLLRQRVEFEIRHLTTTVNLSLGYEPGLRRHLSSFPNTIQWIIDRQSKYGQFKAWDSVAKHPCCGTSRKRNASWLVGESSKRRRVM